MKIFKNFLYSFFILLLPLILVINIDNVLITISQNDFLNATYYGVGSKWDSNYYYFGFTSILDAFGYLGYSFNFGDLVNASNDLFNATTFYIIPTISSGNVLAWVQFIGTALFQPLLVLAYLVKCVACLLLVVVQLVNWFVHIIGGYFNTPMPLY